MQAEVAAQHPNFMRASSGRCGLRARAIGKEESSGGVQARPSVASASPHLVSETIDIPGFPICQTASEFNLCRHLTVYRIQTTKIQSLRFFSTNHYEFMV
jgi:hypothetical protein